MEEEHQPIAVQAVTIINALLYDFSSMIDHKTLRDTLPRRLAGLLRCRNVLLYQHTQEKLYFISGSFDDKPGWSATLLEVAHINPIHVSAELPEAQAWRERQPVVRPPTVPTLLAVPLVYRMRGIGVLVAIRGKDHEHPQSQEYWLKEEISTIETIAGVVALLLENTRLLERDQERIHELSLLNSISSQMNCTMYEHDRFQQVVIQRTREISYAEFSTLLEPSVPKATGDWLPDPLSELLLKRMTQERNTTPLVIERPGDPSDEQIAEYLLRIPEYIKTFFAIPLFSNQISIRRESSLLRGSLGTAFDSNQNSDFLGIIIGAYHKPWKLRSNQLALLRILASQASTVLENMRLMNKVVEARNEARKLFRQVLEDQRFKELILQSIPSGLITTDQSGNITTFNRAASAILGHGSSEVLGQPLNAILTLDTTNMLTQDFPLVSKREQQQVDTEPVYGRMQSGTITSTDRWGKEMFLNIDLLSLHNEPGEAVGRLITFTDITSVHSLEEEKRRLDRLASLGEMAANVAHEVRNPLASIKTSVQIFLDDLADNEPTSQIEQKQRDWARETVSVVLKEVERLDTIVQELLLFARPRQLHCVRCNLADLSDKVLQLIHYQCLEANVAIHRIYDPLPDVVVDIDQMEQILLNLYINALQAMPEGGVLTVSCHPLPAEIIQKEESNEYMRSTLLPSHLSKSIIATQKWVEIVVSDTGIGMTPDQLRQIFQPFFTTKAHGIGLGLAITRRLVEDHFGYLHVESQFGYGASISVRLPLPADDIFASSEES